ncbi:MAG: prolipoprotein diacylglyceryl transferase [Anaerolineales bacterium]|nr:prolipoprotein diacylglyceryl transferase [Anaerolineales bacterium]
MTLLFNFFAPPRHVILLILAIWVGLIVAEKRAAQNALSKDQLNNLIFYSLLGYILGGRGFYVLQNFPAFVKSPLSALALNPDLFDPAGAFLTAALTFFIFIQRNQLAFWSTLDALVPFCAILIIGVGLSHLAAGTGFGIPSDLPWAVDLWSAKRHPTQIYAVIAASITFSWLWFKKQRQLPGLLALHLLTLTAGYTLFISAFQADQTILSSGLKQNQLLAFAALIASFVLYEIRIKQLNLK